MKMIEDRNCQMLIAFALEYNLSALSQLCAEYLIKMMVNRE